MIIAKYKNIVLEKNFIYSFFKIYQPELNVDAQDGRKNSVVLTPKAHY